MASNRTLLVGALFMAGCGADFAAAVHVTIDGPELTTGGGYWIEMRQPDGDTLAGLRRQFVAFAPGSQDVTVVVNKDAFFGGTDSRFARVIVDAVAQRDEPALARGTTKLLEIDRGEVLDVEVELLADPRPFATGVTAAFNAAGTAAAIEPFDLPATVDFVFDLWIDAGERTWLGRLSNGTVILDLGAHRDLVAEFGFTLVVTAEPPDSPEPLKASIGWPVLRGDMPGALVAALITAPAAEEGILAAMAAILAKARDHIQLAVNADTTDDVHLHCEHVFSALAGEAVASADDGGGSKRGDFDGDGELTWINPATDDRTGIVGTPADPGHLDALVAGMATLEGTFDVLDAFACATNTRNANEAALAAVEAFADDPGSAALGAQAQDAVLRVRGAAHDDGNTGSPDQTALCVTAELEAIADFVLQPLDPATN